jgi:hypothetical protein
MKKLLAIIGILLIVLLGMVGYKNNQKKSTVSIEEVSKIEEYLSKIYMWKEVTGEALPRFNNINDAPDLWTWEVVKQNLEDYEVSYEEIQEKSIEIFGESFTKQFPKEGIELMYYNEELGKYLSTGMGLDTMDDSFYIKNITKTQNGYEVEIVEYLEDYGEARESEGDSAEYNVYIKNLDEETIATIKSNESEAKAIEAVKENIDRFSVKKISLTKEDEKIYVKSIE